MGVFSVEFSKNDSGYYSGKYYIRVTISDSYNANTNISTVSVTKVEFKAPFSFASVPVFGKVLINNTVCRDYEGGGNNAYTSSSANSYSECTGGTNYGGVPVAHDSISGTASITITLQKATDISAPRFGIFYQGNAWGITTPESTTKSLDTQTSTLTINPNGGVWNGGNPSQNFYFSQAPLSTKVISNPTKTGYIFNGWTLSGGGSFNSTNFTYTFGSTNSTLTANWLLQNYIVTCEDRVGDAQGELLGTHTETYSYGSTVSGSMWGDSTTYNTYYNGYYYSSDTQATVTGEVTVYRFFLVNTYTLSLTTSPQGVTPLISRVSSPSGGGQTGSLTNGAVIYYNDRITVDYNIVSTYQLTSATVNNISIVGNTPYNLTVTSNVIVSIIVKLGAIVYIGNEAYQVFIWDGTNWNQYQAYIGNGTSFDQY